jgi:hypothetical protein
MAVAAVATPTAPPISRMVSTSPDASPAADSETPENALICTETDARPTATPASRKAGRRSVK